MTHHVRRQALLELVTQRRSVTVAELEPLLGASAATIRRDIAMLDASRQLQKVHGGARVLTPAGLTVVPPTAANVERKRAIARRAAELCRDGETVIVGGGTTTALMAEHLTSARLTILTNSFPLAQTLLATSRNDVLLPGGKVYREQNVIVSPFENDVIQNHYASRMFLGAVAVSPLGLLESDPLVLRAGLKLLRQAEELVVLVDSTKFENRRAGMIVCPLGRVRTLITDDGVGAGTVEMLRGHGIDVIVVPVDGAA